MRGPGSPVPGTGGCLFLPKCWGNPRKPDDWSQEPGRQTISYRKYSLKQDSKRTRMRQDLEVPILRLFWEWFDKQKPGSGSWFAAVVNYVKKQKPVMENYLLDGRIALSNQTAENVIRPFVISRRNLLFSASAVIYSLIESAKRITCFKYCCPIRICLPDWTFLSALLQIDRTCLRRYIILRLPLFSYQLKISI